MLVTSRDIASRGFTVHDCAGQALPGVVSYDTETGEAELLVVSGLGAAGNLRMALVPLSTDAADDSCVIQFEGRLYNYATARAVLPGSYAAQGGRRLSPGGAELEPLTLDCEAKAHP